MNYIGSKKRLSDWIFNTVESHIHLPLPEVIFADVFAGTGAVSRRFKPFVKKVIANDLEYYSFVLLKNYIQNSFKVSQDKVSHLLEELNQLGGSKNFVFQNYSEKGNQERLYFSEENGQKIDTIRLEIEKWKDEGKTNEQEYYFLLASLLESADKVANTASVYGAFLKKLKKSAQKKLELSAALFEAQPHQQNEVFQKDVSELIQEISGDVLYLDPPYNARQYGANYHLLNTIARYDDFKPKGKTGLRDYQKSVYCNKKLVAQSFEDLIAQANFKYIFLSYNNEGLMSFDEIREIMSKYGNYQVETTSYQRFKADKDQNRQHKAKQTTEFLHVLEK